MQTKILQYHVLVGEAKAADVRALLSGSGTAEVNTVLGEALTIALPAGSSGPIMVGGNAELGATDVMGSNGVVHMVRAPTTAVEIC